MYLVFIIIFNAYIRSSTSLSCNNASECINDHLKVGTSRIRGYRAASGKNASISTFPWPTTNSRTSQMYGAYAIEQISFVNTSESFDCYGSNSCKNISNFAMCTTSSTGNYLWCRGSNSCCYSDFRVTASNIIRCEGDQSCSYSDFSEASDIKGFGAYSLLSATIDSNNVIGNILNLNMYGYYAGYGATLICQAADICNINCYGNACYMMHIQCLAPNGENCNVVKYSNSTLEPMNRTATLNISEVLLYDSVVLTTNNDQLCNEVNAMSFDNYKENYLGFNISMDSGSVCCRAFQSCQGVPQIHGNIHTDTPGIVQCSGTWACNEVSVIHNHNGHIYCEGSNSCNYADIITTDNVYCLGGSACQYSNISNAANIFCGAYLGCLETTVRSNGFNLNVYLLGQYAGMFMDLYCNETDYCYIFCGCQDACLDLIVYCDGECVIECETGYDCPQVISLNPTVAPTIPTHNPTVIVVNMDVTIKMNISIISGHNISVSNVVAVLDEVVDEYLSTLQIDATFTLEYDIIEKEINGVSMVVVEVEIDIYDLDEAEVEIDQLQNEIEMDLQSTYDNDVKLENIKIIDHREVEKLIEQKRSFYDRILLYIAICSGCIIIASYIDSGVIRKHDFYKLSGLTFAILQFMDAISDILFAASIHFHQQLVSISSDPSMSDTLFILFILCIIFIILPTFSSIYQLHREMNTKWINNNTEELTAWCARHQIVLYTLGLFSGSSFTAVRLCNSHLFHLDVFSMPLNRLNMASFQNQRILSTVFLENIPQVTIQILYIQWTAAQEFEDPIVYLSLVFSVISVIATIFGLRTGKHLVNQQQFTEIKFDVTGKYIMSSRTKCQRRIRKLQHKIGEVLRSDYKLIEIQKPLPISGGLEITVNVFVSNNKSIEKDFGTMMEDVSKSGQLSEIVKECWELIGVPSIHNIQCKTVQSLNEDILQKMKQTIAGSHIENGKNIEKNLVEITQSVSNVVSNSDSTDPQEVQLH